MLNDADTGTPAPDAREALEWLANRGGSCLGPEIPPELPIHKLANSKQRPKLVANFRGRAGFVGFRITDAGRAAIAKAEGRSHG